jgi:hypothetical protein
LRRQLVSPCPCISERPLDGAVPNARFGVRSLVRITDLNLIQVDIAEIEPDDGWRHPDIALSTDDDLDMGAREGFGRMVRFSRPNDLKKALFHADRLGRFRHSHKLPSYPVSALLLGLALGHVGFLLTRLYSNFTQLGKFVKFVRFVIRFELTVIASASLSAAPAQYSAP